MPLRLFKYRQVLVGVADDGSEFGLDFGLVAQIGLGFEAIRGFVEQFANGDLFTDRVVDRVGLLEQIVDQEPVEGFRLPLGGDRGLPLLVRLDSCPLK